MLEIIEPGLLTTIQDQGISGYKTLGIAEGGAMDRVSFVIANRLVGNPDKAAVLEITLVGPGIRFLGATWCALGGADLSAQLNGSPVPPNRAFHAGSGDILSFGPSDFGVRAYLAVQGGIDVPLTLGSRCTYLYAGFGGFEGRSLRKGDVLHAAAPRQEEPPALAEPPLEVLVPKNLPSTLRVILGPHEDYFAPEAIQTFFSEPYEVTPESNRMGYRLKGPQLTHRETPIVVSTATPLGGIQVPGKGIPVILLRERGTTGGYTQIGCVITRDLDILAQSFAGDTFRFTHVDVADAQAIERRRWEKLDAWCAPL